MKNPRITAKERGLIKGALRRVFSRSDLRREAVQESIRNYSEGARPRVKKWSLCPECQSYTPTYLMEVDHVEPVIPLDKTLEDMSFDDLINRLWCDKINLMAICKECHKIKTAEERKLRKRIKK